MNGLLCNALDEVKRLSASFQEMSFTIEDSLYKVQYNVTIKCIITFAQQRHHFKFHRTI